MKTLRRYIEEGRVYSVTTTTIDKRQVFIKPETALQVIREIYRIREKGYLYLLAFVIMPEHLHLLCQPIEKDISLIMRHVKRNSSKNLRTYHGIETPLWVKRFYDQVIDSYDGVLNNISYIHYNPVRRGLVEKPEDYPFSSANPDYEVDWEEVL